MLIFELLDNVHSSPNLSCLPYFLITLLCTDIQNLNCLKNSSKHIRSSCFSDILNRYDKITLYLSQKGFEAA